MNSQMNTQTSSNPTLQASSWGTFYEVSETEMAAEMAVIVQPSLFDKTDTEMAPEDFERVYQWFLS
jgi:hypothetical protein